MFRGYLLGRSNLNSQREAVGSGSALRKPMSEVGQDGPKRREECEKLLGRQQHKQGSEDIHHCCNSQELSTEVPCAGDSDGGRGRHALYLHKACSPLFKDMHLLQKHTNNCRITAVKCKCFQGGGT